MRSLVPDEKYFRFLDGLRESGGVNIVLAPGALMREFPTLHNEEAKAVCADWRATYRQRHPAIRSPCET